MLTKTDPWPAYQVCSVAMRLGRPSASGMGPDDTPQQAEHFQALQRH